MQLTKERLIRSGIGRAKNADGTSNALNGMANKASSKSSMEMTLISEQNANHAIYSFYHNESCKRRAEQWPAVTLSIGAVGTRKS